jgi:hypothetical protein
MMLRIHKSNLFQPDSKIRFDYTSIIRWIKRNCPYWFLCILLLNGCDESLPPYRQPENLLAIDRIEISQGIYSVAGDYLVKFHIYGKNLFDETFSEPVNIQGNVHIWNKKQPDLTATLSLNNTNFGPNTNLSGNVLTISPGEEFELRVTWNSHTDDGEDLADFINGSTQTISAKSEDMRDFYVQAEVTLFEELGLIQSVPVLFVFNG